MTASPLALLQPLRDRILINSFDYDAHIALIQGLRQISHPDSGDDKQFSSEAHAELESARLRMAAVYPLSPQMWIDWAKDRFEAAAGFNAKLAALNEIHKKALEDYADIKIMLNWTDLMQQLVDEQLEGAFDDEEKGDEDFEEQVHECIREAFETCLSLMGLHLEAGELWDRYTNFEAGLLKEYRAEGDVSGERAAADRIGALFKRRLSVPLNDVNAALEVLSQWDAAGGVDVKAIEKGSIGVKAQVALRKPFEENIKSARGEENSSALLPAAWLKYVEFEESKKDLARIHCVLERAVCDCPTDSHIWSRYCYTFTDRAMFSKALPVFHRALRNVVWSAELWADHIRCIIAASNGRESVQILESIQNVYNSAKAAGLFQNISSHACVLNALIEGKWSTHGEDDEIVKMVLSDCDWACQELEAVHGDDISGASEVLLMCGRKLLSVSSDCEDDGESQQMEEQGLQMITDGLSHVQDETNWIVHAHFVEGSGLLREAKELLRKGCSKCSSNFVILSQLSAIEKRSGAMEGYFKSCKKFRDAYTRAAANNAKQMASSAAKPMKRQADTNGDQRQPPTKKSKPNSDSNTKEAEASASREPIARSSRDETLTLFVKNLNFSVNENDLQDFFGGLLDFKSLRLVRDRSGQSKGFAYVDFTSKDGVEAGCQLNGSELKGRQVVVLKSKPPKNAGNDSQTLYLTGIPSGTDETALKSWFGELEQHIKEVRIPRDLHGRVRGYGYVEMDSDDKAKKALALDKRNLTGACINVQMSNKPFEKGRESSGLSLGGIPSRNPSSVPKSTPAKRLVPASVAAKKPAATMMIPPAAAGRGRGKPPASLSSLKRRSGIGFSTPANPGNDSMDQDATQVPAQTEPSKQGLSNQAFKDMFKKG